MTRERSSERTAERPVALVTGVGRTRGIGAAVALRLAGAGWDVAFTHWAPYDARMPWGAEPGAAERIGAALAERGAAHLALEADLADPEVPDRVVERVSAELGAPAALVLCHCESVDTPLLDTGVESFDRHFAVNARASWLLVRAFARAFTAPRGSGRIVALTSDHTVGNLPYGASKAALDRIVVAAREPAHLGVSANAVNPGPVDTGWMTPELKRETAGYTPLGRTGTPEDTADLVEFLCSPRGGWVNGQLLHSDGGISAPS
ncbi:SDR family oxidoreductase [Nocardiopsis changdeensis]|uniref:SDR family oxidoreductase n=1 Tax=Nocardiopsis changdeensis TaxID=2831969 RepID=UPI003F48826F